MEWVETTGRTIEEAKDRALDQLGVDEQDAEFEIVEEPRSGLFGRLRAEARVRARVRPTTPRPKEERRDRRRRRSRAGAGENAGTGESSPGTETAGDPGAQAGVTGAKGQIATVSAADRATASPSTRPSGRQPRRAAQRAEPASARPRRSPAPAGTEDREAPDDQGLQTDDDGGPRMMVPLDEQANVARQFLDGLFGEMDVKVDIKVVKPDEDTVELNIDGQDLGLLIGPKGATLLALQDLTRTVVQRRTSAANGRLMVDVGGYRHKRKEALERFARQVAEGVRADGAPKTLEPMTAADRKIVHDAINEIDGVSTTSEGEEPRRRVVILPAKG
jgi:spoIIIJ-associated protein